MPKHKNGWILRDHEDDVEEEEGAEELKAEEWEEAEQEKIR